MEGLDFILKSLGILITFVGGLWAFTKYVIERGLIPATQLDIECKVLGEKGDQKILELVVHLINIGNAVLVVDDIRLRIKHTLSSDSSFDMYDDLKKRGRLKFPHLTVGKKIAGQPDKTFVQLLPYNTFVQPKIDQKYSYITVVEKDADYLHVHADFKYGQKKNFIQKVILKLSRVLGLIQYSLDDIYERHSVQKAFHIE